MLRKFYFVFYFTVSWIFLSSANFVLFHTANGQDLLKVELDREIAKGNFLIGLKQYLGGKNDTFSKNNNITFTTTDSFINLQSFNGIKHKSKKINITLQDIPIKTPYSTEKIVFGPYASFESAQKQAIKLREKNFEAIVTYPKDWEVWIPIESDLSNKEFKYNTFKKIYNTQITPFLNSQYTFQKLEGPVYIFSDEEIKINNINFGKQFYLVRDSYGTWTLIQKIKFDDYLEGVLPYEIGSNSHLEALKAQAVIARTWGIYNSHRFRMDNYHLCVTTQCQVYKPPKFENKKIQKAIKETSNFIITYDNKPINSFYHGSNGGITARASESWAINDYSYFTTKIDGTKTLKKSFELPISNEYELNQFLELEKDKFYGKNHYLFRWSKEISSFNIKDILVKNKFAERNNEILDLKVLERGLSGRVTKLEIKLKKSNKSIVLSKDNIRSVLKFLPSNLFTINKLNDNLWLFRGGGFGHGVGLSQSGAIEMAELGFTYEQILNHYFPRTKLKKFEILSQ